MSVTRNNKRDGQGAKRKKRFLAALAMAGMSMREWATKNDLTAGHVSQYLSGKRDSAVLDERVDAFTAKHLRDVAA